MRQTFLWGLLGLGTCLYIGGLLGPNQRQAAPLIHLFSRSTSTATIKGLENFAYPVGLVFADQKLWVVDHNNNRILLVKKDQSVQTIAGTGAYTASGDGGLAVKAGIFPLGMARDSQGNVYLADHNNHRIRKISTQGIITTLAGTGTAGFAGDGGPATQAQLDDPTGVAVDQQGVVYIADQQNQRIRKVVNGVMTTIPLGQTLKSPWSVALDCQQRLLIVDLGHDQILRWDGKQTTVLAGVGTTGSAGDGGLATAAQLSSPAGVAVQCGEGGEELFIADSGNDRIRRVDAKGIMTTFAGTGEFGFDGDGGPALQAQLGSPYAVATDSEGNVYLADANNNRIRRINRKGMIDTVLSPEQINF
jgi:trimeric autotransporter adhesin